VERFRPARVLVNFSFLESAGHAILARGLVVLLAASLSMTSFRFLFLRIVPDTQNISQSLKQEEIARSEIRAILRYDRRNCRKKSAGFYAPYRPAISELLLPEEIKYC
jgi:hypothetical protein